jgi:septal ring-binding cell division protein DamX
VPMVKSFLDEPLPAEELADGEATGGPHDSDWLLSQPENHYTIQVLSAISEARAQDYISRQDDPEQFAIFCKQGKTRLLYIVVCGVFEDRAAAKKASGKLADATVSPWIRMLSSVHAEIRACTEA